MKRRTKFENLQKMALKTAFEIPESGNDYGGKIVATPIQKTPSAYGVEVNTLLKICQEGGCGTIFLDQEQGEVLAEQLWNLFHVRTGATK